MDDVVKNKLTPNITKALEQPFEKIKWRIQQVIKSKQDPDKSFGIYMAYIDQRDVTDRLNEVVGAENWEFSWQEVPVGEERYIEPAVEGEWKTIPEKNILKLKYAVKGILTVMGNTKEDVGYATMEEDKSPLKAAVSDALKRCAVQFGIGKFLYSIGTQFIEVNPKTKKPINNADLKKLENMFNKNATVVSEDI